MSANRKRQHGFCHRKRRAFFCYDRSVLHLLRCVSKRGVPLRTRGRRRVPHVFDAARQHTRAREIDTAAAPFTIANDVVCHQTPLLPGVEQKGKHHPKTADYYSDRRSGLSSRCNDTHLIIRLRGQTPSADDQLPRQLLVGGPVDGIANRPPFRRIRL
jgi:hypothetical protein